MERINEAFLELKDINSNYELSNEEIDKHINNLTTEKVCTPIIGKFSSGKSALCNSILQSNILSEDITPETAVPTEIMYADDGNEYVVVYTDQGEEKISIEEYFNYNFQVDEVKKVRLVLQNEFLGRIRDVMLVDMPGFESGIELHNKAIDNYVAKSQAYIVTFSVDEMIVKSSIGNILHELCLHDMPIYIVITKCDKEDKETIREKLSELLKGLKKYVGERDIEIAYTSSKEGYIDEAINFLEIIEDNSNELMRRKYIKLFDEAAKNTEDYLSSLIKNSQLTESELAEKEDSLNAEMKNIAEKISKENNKFDKDISECIELIKSDLRTRLYGSESTLVAMAINNQDISEQLNTTVRAAVTESIQSRFIPLVEKYVNKISDTINVDTYAAAGGISGVEIKDNIAGPVIAGIAAFVISAIPIVGIIVGALGLFISKMTGNKKREEEKARIRQKLKGEVFPQVMNQVGSKIEIELKGKIEEIREEVSKSIEEKNNNLQKSIDDVRAKRKEEEDKLRTLIADAQSDIERIGVIRNEL